MKPTIYAPFLSLVALAACNNLYSPTPTSVRFTGRPWPGGSSFS